MTFLRWAPISPQRAPERKGGEGSTGANAPDRCRSVRIGGDGSEERRPRRAAHQPLGRARRGDVLLAIVGGAAGVVASALTFAVVMGLVGGVLPAARAARLNIVNALRAS